MKLIDLIQLNSFAKMNRKRKIQVKLDQPLIFSQSSKMHKVLLLKQKIVQELIFEIKVPLMNTYLKNLKETG